MSVLKYYNTLTSTWLPAALGDAGPIGPTGAPGNDSMVPGPTGDQGPIGPTGNDGTPGITGPQGEVGATGPQGEVGPTGNDGTPGVTGPTGDAGPTGPQGEVGPTGAQGTAGIDTTSTLYNGTLTVTLNATGDLVPSTDILQDLGSAVNRFRHVYVGPGSVYIGSNVITESATGNLVLPGLTRATGYYAEEVDNEDRWGSNPVITGAVTVIDAKRYDILSGRPASADYLPATYSAQKENNRIEEIDVSDGGGGWTKVEADYARDNNMYATNVVDAINNFSAGDWVQIPFRVEVKAEDTEYEDIFGGGTALPSQNEQDGKFLTTDGEELSWATVSSGPTGPQGSQGVQGPTGSIGPTGAGGQDGDDGVGIPAGGSSGQVLAKINGDDYNTEWVDQSGGSGAEVAVSDTAPTATAGTQWYNTVDGRTYIAYNGQWVDASPVVVPQPSTYLDEITIDGSTININDNTLTISNTGTLLINGAEVAGGGVSNHIEYTDTATDYVSTLDLTYDFAVDVDNAHLDINGDGYWSIGSNNFNAKVFSTDDPGNQPTCVVVRADNDDWTFGPLGMLTLPEGGIISNGMGAIRLDPAGSGSTQALLIYPTAAAEGDHIHLTAGGGDTDLYLGNDDQFVKIDHGGDIVVGTYSTATTSTWTFGTDGVLTLPNDMTIDASVSFGIVTIGGTSTYISIDNGGAPPALTIATNQGENAWQFGDDGVLTLSTASTILGNSSDPNVYIETATTSTTSTWTFAADGSLTLPDQGPILFGGNNCRIQALQAFSISSDGGIAVEVTDKQWAFGLDGNLTTPSNLVIGPGPGSGSSIFQYNEGLQILGEGANSVVQIGWTANTSAPDSVALIAMNYPNGGEGNILFAVGNNATTVNYWLFDNTGTLTLPAGGDIVDSTGASVLGGAVGATNQITSGSYSVSVADTGVVTMVTDRGTLEFGALPEAGGTQHFHVMKGAGQDGSGGMDLFFGDDYNYVLQRPDSYQGSPAYGVEIGTKDLSTGTSNQHVWRFETDGGLTIPGNIQKTTDASIVVGSNYSPITNVAISAVDYDAPVWRIFVDADAYPNLGIDATAGDTITTSWGTPITATIQQVIDDRVGSSQWVFTVDQNVATGFTGPGATTTFNSVSKTWTFGLEGGLTLPNGATIVDTTSTLVLTPNSPAQSTSLVLRSTYNSYMTADYPTDQSYQQYLYELDPVTYPNDSVSTGTEGTVIAITLLDYGGLQYLQGDVDYVITGTGITAADFTPAVLTGTFLAANWIQDGSIYTNTNMIMIADDAIVEGEETFTVTIITNGTYAPGSGSNYLRVNIADGTTEGSESGHIHLISENMAQTSIFLGNDDKYVKVAADDQIYIKVPNADTSATSQLWTFGTDGSTTLPIGVSIDEYYGSHFPRIVADTGKAFSVQGLGSTGSVALQWMETESTSSQIAQVGLNKFSGVAAVTLTAGTSTNDMKVWRFDETGSTTFPDSTVQTTAYPGILVPADGDGVSGNANMVFYAGTDWYNTSKVTINPTSSMLTLNGNSGTGGITFPDATVQTTAYTGSTSTLVNGTYTVALSTTGQLNLPGAANAESNNARIQSTNSIDILSNLSIWTFSNTGTLTFPDGTVQTTAFTGSGAVSNTGTTSTFVISNTETSNSTNTGALQVAGGVGIGGGLFVGGNITATNITALASTATVNSTAASVGYMGLPQNATGSATLTISDAGKHVYITTTGQTITIPANASVAYPIGTAITFIAGPSATTVTIDITTDTMYLAGTGTTGTRTLAAHGMATAVKVAATTWYINGVGLT